MNKGTESSETQRPEGKFLDISCWRLSSNRKGSSTVMSIYPRGRLWPIPRSSPHMKWRWHLERDGIKIPTKQWILFLRSRFHDCSDKSPSRCGARTPGNG